MRTEDQVVDPFIWAPPVKGVLHSLCSTCKWKHEGASTCFAFGGGIPTGILLGTIDHRKPLAGDLGIQYETDGQGGIDPGDLLSP